jgi:hypothetical protein
MLPSQIREALFRMSQGNATEHKMPETVRKTYKSYGPKQSALGMKGRYAAGMTTPIALPNSPVFKKRTLKQALKARRRGGKRVA